MRVRERDRDRERHRETQRERHRDRDSRETHRERVTETHRERLFYFQIMAQFLPKTYKIILVATTRLHNQEFEYYVSLSAHKTIPIVQQRKWAHLRQTTVTNHG